jgi:hypothetical protein
MSGVVSETLAMIAGRAREVLDSLGIAFHRKHILCPLPSHADRNPSWRFDFARAKWHCTCGGGDPLDLIIAMGHAADPTNACRWVRHQLALPPLAGENRETPAEAAERRRKNIAMREAGERRKAEKQAKAEKADAASREQARLLWGSSLPIEGTFVETYLRSRGVTCRIPQTIGFLPQMPEFLAKEHGQHPCMIAAFGLPVELEPGELFILLNNVAGVHLTLLAPDGRSKAAVMPNKITLGRGHDLPIGLAAMNDGLGLCVVEGIEEALTAHQRTGLGAWAAGTANRLPGIARHIPAYCEAVTVFEDDDDAGRHFTLQLARALIDRDAEVRILSLGDLAHG